MADGDHRPVVIAVDPHKTSWTAAAVSSPDRGHDSGHGLPARHREPRRFARCWPQARWAPGGATGLGSPLLSRPPSPPTPPQICNQSRSIRSSGRCACSPDTART
jgi:hypothetical protein